MSQKKPLLIIAGFSDGLGSALLRKYIHHGYQVVVLSRYPQPMDEHDNVEVYAVDLTNPDSANIIFDKVFTQYGIPDVVIHNPAHLVIAPLGDTSMESFTLAWETACLSAFICAQACLPKMKYQQSTMIFTGATASIRGGDKFAAFASAKFAVRGLVQALAREYSSQGVHIVHTIIDGLIWGPNTIERFNPVREACLLPEDIADVYFSLTQQPPSAWTHELDLRPAGERF